MTVDSKIVVSNDLFKLSSILNSNIKEIAAKAIQDRGQFVLAISGGSLPSTLALELKNVGNENTDKWHIFLADERCVPLDSCDSNYLLVKEHVLSQIQNAHVYPIRHFEDPDKAAKEYILQLKSVFKSPCIQFDLILLGIGPDGHTCSLFPSHPLLDATEEWVYPIYDSPKPPPKRITLSYSVLNQSLNNFFVVTGNGKAQVLYEILNLKKDYPSTRVKGERVVWFLDTDAASKLDE